MIRSSKPPVREASLWTTLASHGVRYDNNIIISFCETSYWAEAASLSQGYRHEIQRLSKEKQAEKSDLHLRGW